MHLFHTWTTTIGCLCGSSCPASDRRIPAQLTHAATSFQSALGPVEFE